MYKVNNDENSKTYFLNNVNWLVNNAVPKEDYLLLQYNFPLPIYNLKAPWFSAMANGLALQVLIKAHELTQDFRYLIAAKSLLNAFFIEVEHGGITYKDSPNEWWYEEYASNDKNAKISRVLNGMLFTVVAIYDYYKYTNDSDAKLLFDKGINSIKKELYRYNNNGYSYYDLLGNPAHTYHQIHIDLTKKLYDITGEVNLNKYSELWKNLSGLDGQSKKGKIYQAYLKPHQQKQQQQQNSITELLPQQRTPQQQIPSSISQEQMHQLQIVKLKQLLEAGR